MMMDTVTAENTDTPYHRALRDFAAGNYKDALAKYQDIVDNAPKDRIGLLGLAMSYEKLGRDKEAVESYQRYLVVEPANEEVASRMLQKAMALPKDEARARVESFITAGVQRPDYLSALAELSSAAGENEKALKYAVLAVEQSPNTAMYKLNAAVLADRLKRKGEAAALYEQFLAIFERSPVVMEVSIAAIRERMRYLQSGL